MKFSLVTLLAPAFILAACSHAAIEKSINQKLSQESGIKTNAELNAEQKTAIDNAKDISPEQKSKLSSLRVLTRQKLGENNQQSLKLKAVLIQDLVAEQYKENEAELIKSKLKSLQSKRLAIIFQAVEEANSILGRQARLNDDVMRDFVRIEHD